MNIIQSIITLFIRKYYGMDLTLTILTLCTVSLGSLILRKKPKLIQLILSIPSLLSTLDIIFIPGKSLQEFASKLIIGCFSLGFKNLMLQDSWMNHIKYNFFIVVMILGLDQQLSIAKIQITLTIFILGQIFFYLCGAYLEQKIKTLWAAQDKSKKIQKSLELFIYELPVPLLIVNDQKKVILQNYLSYKILPKDVDVRTNQYTKEVRTIDHLYVNPQDLQRVKESIDQTFTEEKLTSLGVSIQGHIYSMILYFQKVTWQKQRCVLITCLEQGEPHQQLYRGIVQGQQVKLLRAMADILQTANLDIIRVQYQLIQMLTMYSPISILSYQYQASLSVNLHNYLKFFMDLLNCTFYTNIPLSLKIQDDLPQTFLLDPLRLHMSLIEIVSFVQQQYQIKQQSILNFNSLHNIKSDKDIQGLGIVAENNENISLMFLVCERLQSEDRQELNGEKIIRLGFQFDFKDPIVEQQMIFQDIDFQFYNNAEKRLKIIARENDPLKKQFYHVLHMIAQSLDGNVQIFEKSQMLKIDIVFSLKVEHPDDSTLFQKYSSQGRIEENSKNLILWSREDSELRFKLITGTKSKPHSQHSIRLQNRRQTIECQTIQEENSRTHSDELNCSILEKKLLNLTSNSNTIAINYIPAPSKIKFSAPSEEEKKENRKNSPKQNIFSPGLSPIPRLVERRKDLDKKIQEMKILNQQTNPNQQFENLDMDEEINKYMHHLEKGVSKTLEKILSDIMTYKGKRINLHFKSSVKKRNMKNYDTSPDQSDYKDQFLVFNATKKEIKSTRDLNANREGKPSLFKQENQNSNTIDASQNQATQEIPQVKVEDNNPFGPDIKVKNTAPEQPKFKKPTAKFASFLSNLREDDAIVHNPPTSRFISTNPVSTEQLSKNSQQEDIKQTSVQVTEQEYQYITNDHVNQQSNIYSFQKISSPVQQSTDSIQQSNSQTVPKQVFEKIIEQPMDSIKMQNNIPSEPKQKLCAQFTLFLIDDFVFVLNQFSSMKIDEPKVVHGYVKTAEALQKFKKHLNDGFLYHCVLVDTEMPKPNLNGYEFVQEIRKFEKEVGAPPHLIFALDNDLTDAKMLKIKQAGYDDGYEKPINQGVFKQIVQKSYEYIKSHQNYY